MPATEDESPDGINYIDVEVDPESALLENYSMEDGGKLIDFLELKGYERPEDFELGREVNETYAPEEPVLKYLDGGEKKVVSDTAKILELFGLDTAEFSRFKEQAYDEDQ